MLSSSIEIYFNFWTYLNQHSHHVNLEVYFPTIINKNFIFKLTIDYVNAVYIDTPSTLINLYHLDKNG